MVSPVKQIWKDFSSGKGGNAVTFLMEHEHFTYPEAIKYLAKKYGIEIEEIAQTDEQKQQADARESLYLVNEFATGYFQNNLLKTELGKAIGLSYFKERGFTQQTIEKFKLGYSLDQWSAFTDQAIKKGYKLEFLEQTGLTIAKQEKQYDRFKGRVMFPILSMSGRTLGFGGRILTNDKKAAKYLNSPESDVYHKSKVLYGIYNAKQSIAKEDNCYLVEGYTDVIQFAQRGISNVVSSSGTALTPEQIRLVNRLTQNITVLFDGDAAGLRASIRGVDLILEQGMNVKICTFPEGEDPDSFAKNNTLDVLQSYLLENAKDFISFKASLLAKEAVNDPIKKAETIRDMVVSISKIPDHIKREVYIKECARIMDISEQVLFNTLAQIIQKQAKADSKKAVPTQQAFNVITPESQPTKKIDELFELERKIIEILLLYGASQEDFEDLILEANENGEISFKPETSSSKVFEKIYLDLQDDEIEFTNETFKGLYTEIITQFNQGKDFQVDTFMNEQDPAIASLVSDILMDDERHTLHDWERMQIYVKDKNSGVAQIVSETILNLRRLLITMKIKDLVDSPSENGSYKDRSVLETVKDYNTLHSILSEKLRRVV